MKFGEKFEEKKSQIQETKTPKNRINTGKEGGRNEIKNGGFRVLHLRPLGQLSILYISGVF